MGIGLRKAKETLIGFMPKRVRTVLVQKFRFLTPSLPRDDYRIRIKNEFYGELQLFLNPAKRLERNLLYCRYYDLKTLLYIKRLIRQHDVIFDIGAHIGSIAFALAQRTGAMGRVFAFEPGPPYYERLARNVNQNPRFQEIIQFENYGLSNHPGVLYWCEDNCGALKKNRAFLKERKDTAVKITTIDNYIQKHHIMALDFIKIDVEGMELEVIEGGLSAIQEHKPLILFETNGVNGTFSKIEGIFSLLSGMGYKFFEIDVPERYLAERSTDFNFIECCYPNLPRDTLAVPSKHMCRLA